MIDLLYLTKILIIMKRILFALSIIWLTSCICIGQIPDQTIYVDENCEAILPDYTPDVIVTDNCDNSSLTQIPTPGLILTAAQLITQIMITATDISGNTASITFNVILVDTIAPIITAGPSLLSYTWDQTVSLLQAYQRGVANVMTQNINDPTNTWYQDSTVFKDEFVTFLPPINSGHWMASVFKNPDDMWCICDSIGLANYTMIRLEINLEE